MLLRRLHIRRFKTRLAVLIGGVIAIWLYVVGAYFVEQHAGAVTDARGEALHATALTASRLLTTEVEERSLEINVLAQTLAHINARLDSTDALEMLKLRKGAHNEYLWIGIGGKDGRVIQATDGILLGESVSLRPWFKGGWSGPYTGDVHEAVLLAKHLPAVKPDQPLRFIDFASPVKGADGAVRGVLGAHASWDWVTDTIVNQVRDARFDRELEIMIANRKGDILYPFEKIGVTHLPQGHLPSVRYKVSYWSDRGAFLTSTVPVRFSGQQKLDWIVVVREPMAVASAPVNHLRLKLIAIGLGAGLILVFAVYYFARKECQPIEVLADVAGKILRREPDVIFPDAKIATSSELAQLCATFNSMAESLLASERKLGELNESLERQVEQRTNELRQANVKLAELATKDPLTGLANRRFFEERLVVAFQQMKRNAHPYSILMVDVDFFKSVNDSFGHETGDNVLRKLAQLLSSCLRNTDLVARYGGEEFIVLLAPVTSGLQAFVVANKICDSVAKAYFPSVKNVTVSIGLAAASIEDINQETAIRRADRALYKAKEKGRNCVVVA